MTAGYRRGGPATTKSLWIAGFCVIALIAAAVLVPRIKVLPESPESRALTTIAAAESRAFDSGGGYLSFAANGTDRELANFEPEIGEGVDDAMVIACDDGWVAAVAVDERVALRSNVADATHPAPADDLQLPPCVTRVAVDSLLADVGWSVAPEPATKQALQRPAGADPLRPGVHVTPPNGFMNDPQRPVFVDGLWHLYYLYNADYPEGNGTAWFHATSPDLVEWTDEGVAIEKFRTEWGDVESGTVVVDERGDAGYGEGTLVAILTQQVEGIQRQSLFFSTDGGYSFESYTENPVLDNPGVTDFRDPRVVWDSDGDRWTMVLAEGERLGFYSSTNLTDWEYASDFAPGALGLLECPDLFRMHLDGDPARPVWVLAASANGERLGRATGVAYWTGDWDGTTFTVDGDSAEPRWMDSGPDYYAGVTWPDPRLTPGQQAESRYALGWLNNWAYARELPESGWTRGAQSVTRVLRLESTSGPPRLAMTPLPGLDRLAGPARDIRDSSTVSTPFRVDLDLSIEGSGEVRLVLTGADGASATIGVRSDGRAAPEVFVARDDDTAAAVLKSEDYSAERAEPLPGADDVMALTVIVDTSSMEVFAGNGALTQSALVDLGGGDVTVSVEEVDDVEARSATIRGLSPVQL